METDLVVKKDTQIVEVPVATVARAKLAATALQQVIAQKPKPVVIRGEQFLEYEDWQLLGQFYGVAVQTGDAVSVNINGIWGAKASAKLYDIHTGLILGGVGAEAYCMEDEERWGSRPWHQLASMAQTRAGAKALRNRFAWVVVLAGYKPTPAEELHDDKETKQKPSYKTPAKAAPKVKSAPINPEDIEFDGSPVESLGDLWTRCKNYNISKTEGLQLLELGSQEEIIDLDESWKVIFESKFNRDTTEENIESAAPGPTEE